GAGSTKALGGAYTTSSGTRQLAASTLQQINDTFHQASSAIRELRSTIVVQANQTESSTVQTRTVANYNHSHALTILYYEVLRHYRVVSRVASQRAVLFVDYSDRTLDTALNSTNLEDVVNAIVANRDILEPALLDLSLKDCFQTAQKLWWAFQAPLPAPANT